MLLADAVSLLLILLSKNDKTMQKLDSHEFCERHFLLFDWLV